MNSKAKLAEILKGAKSLRIHHVKGDVLEIYTPGGDAEADVLARAERAIQRGSAVTFADGRKEWIDVNPIVEWTANGSDQYTWHTDGERVLNTKERIVVQDGISTRTAEDNVWRKF